MASEMENEVSEEDVKSAAAEFEKKIDELEALLSAMAARMRELAITASQRNTVVDERPPHY